MTEPLETIAEQYVSEEKEVKDVADAIAGARDIIAEQISDNADYKTVGGESTTDKVFILNSQQELKYQKTLNNNDRTCWLIEPGQTQSTAQFSAYGHIMTYGYPVSAVNLYARPALWVSAE